jgi:hypothetical protein
MIYEFRPFYVEIETETLLELEEIPKPPESHRAILFGSAKKVVKYAKEEREQNNLVDKRKQNVFGNILKIIKK